MPKPPPLTTAKRAFTSKSAALKTDYVIYTHTPDPETEPGPWPAVVFLDGDYVFDEAVKACAALREAGKIPPVAIVAIGYGKGFGSPLNHRGRDYTQTCVAEMEPSSGGAEGFLDYLTGTLWPELEQRYPLDRAKSVLAGHSLGGLFALYALFQPKPFFGRVLAGAPSIWWADRSLLAMIAKLRDEQSTLQAEVFLGAGADETESMIGDLDLLRKQLAARPFDGLTVTEEVFPGRDHYNVTPDLFRAGLTALLGPKT